MKSFVLAAALVGCIVACNTTDKQSVTDPATPNTPKAECSADKASCSETKASCPEMKASAEKKSCCASQKPQG
jgi:hypothetical protein